MVSNQIGLEVLVPLGVLLVILILIFATLLCKYYLWSKLFGSTKRKRRQFTCASPSATGHPYLPPLKPTTVPRQLQYNEQHSIYRDLSLSKNRFSYSRLPNDEHIHFDCENRSLKSEPSEASFASDTSQSEFSPNERRISSVKSDFPPQSRKISRQRAICSSEPSLAVFDDQPVFEEQKKKFSLSGDKKRRRYSSTASNRKLSSASAAMSLIAPVGGQIEFCLFYCAETKTLDITINQLLDVALDAENFLGILDVYDKNDKLPKTNKAYLKRNHHHVLELVNANDVGFCVYVTLLPKKTFRKSTEFIFSEGGIVFNEKLSITGYSLEHLYPFLLCFHALCQFGKDGEPIVLGEVKVPLKRVQVSQVIPFMANLGAPEEELELANSLRANTNLGELEIYLSFNPHAQKLVVKIIQATNLPKYGMTGQPNVSVKVSLYFCNSRRNKKRTSTQKKQRNPVFNETFQFDLSRERLPECDIVFELLHHGPMYRTPIGYVTVGNSAGGEGTQHWLQLLDFSYHEKMHKILPTKPVNLL